MYNNLEYFQYEALRFVMFSSHIDMIYKNSAFQDIFVKYYLSSVGSPRRYPLYEKVMSEYISTNFGSIRKGAKPLNSGYLLVAPRFNR